MFTIQVFYKQDGKPAPNQRVSCQLRGGFFSGGFTKEEFTNDSGEVHFNNDPGEGIVYVGKNNVYDGNISGRVIVYI